jgi:hypothetical protein
MRGLAVMLCKIEQLANIDEIVLFFVFLIQG